MAKITKLRTLPIGELSRRTGVNVETIRYYERIGIMPDPARTDGGHRIYDGDQVRRLAFVKRGRELGFSLEEIRVLLDFVEAGTYTCSEIHGITIEHLKAVQKKISDLRRLERVLKGMSADCSRGQVPECPIIDALFDTQLGT